MFCLCSLTKPQMTYLEGKKDQQMTESLLLLQGLTNLSSSLCRKKAIAPKLYLNANYLWRAFTGPTLTGHSGLKLKLATCLHSSLLLFTFCSGWGGRGRASERLRQGGAGSREVRPHRAGPARPRVPQAPRLPHGGLTLPPFPEVAGQAGGTERRKQLQCGWCWRRSP